MSSQRAVSADAPVTRRQLREQAQASQARSAVLGRQRRSATPEGAQTPSRREVATSVAHERSTPVNHDASRAVKPRASRHQWVPRLALLGTLAIVTTVVPLTGAALPESAAEQSQSVNLATVSALDVLAGAATMAGTDTATALTADPLATSRALVNASRSVGDREALTCGTLAYEANGVVAAETSTTPIELVQPLAAGSYRVTSPYGYRIHPIYGAYSEHAGVDLAAPAGTPIHAVADGIVTYAGPGKDGRSGMLVVIKHTIDGAPAWTWYIHMYPNGVYVTEGDQVSAGDVIGDVGSYGNSTGPHLHLEVHVDEKLTTVDPVAWLANNDAAPLTAENLACAAG